MSTKFGALFDERLQKPAATEERTVGRKAGKRSHPDYKQFSILLKKDTHKKAVRTLDDLENGKDLSDLMQELLQEWVDRNVAKT